MKTQENADRFGEESILAEQVRLYELQQSAFQQALNKQAPVSEQGGTTEEDLRRQQGINKLFEIALSPDNRIIQEEPRTKNKPAISISNEIPDKPTSSLYKVQGPARVKYPSKYEGRKSSNLSTKRSHRHFSSSLREFQRQQKRKNLMRLNFDPRRRQ